MGDEVRLAILEALGVASPERVPTPSEAAADVVDQLAVAHEHDLAAGEVDLSDRLAARFGPQVLHDPRMLVAVDSVIGTDRDAHAVARDVVHRDLSEAFSQPAGRREQAVDAVVEAERARVRARAGTRVARATRGVLASLRLPDDAYEPVAGGG